MKTFLAALLLLFPASALAQEQVFIHLVVPDSVDAQVLKDYARPQTRVECLDVLDARPDSVVFQKAIPVDSATDCPGHNGLIAFVRDTNVTTDNLDVLNAVVIHAYPHLLAVCGGRREADGANLWAVVPECHIRRPKEMFDAPS
jgi:hypothetical protein